MREFNYKRDVVVRIDEVNSLYMDVFIRVLNLECIKVGWGRFGLGEISVK